MVCLNIYVCVPLICFRVKINGYELLGYESKNETKLVSRSVLKGMFLKEEIQDFTKTGVIYPFTLFLSQSSFVTFFTTEKSARDKWVYKLKIVLGYSSIDDEYHFGVVFQNNINFFSKSLGKEDMQ